MNHILLVEGSRDSALHLSRLITRNLDAELIQASSGEEALDLIQRRPVDLVIVDVQLPQIDGFDICSRLHELESTQRIPVLLLTTLEGESYPDVKALSMGPGEIYTLPTPGSNLVTWIKILLKLASEHAIGREAFQPTLSSRTEIYRLLLDATDNAVLWADAASGEIRIASAGAEAVTGYPISLLEGKTIWDLAPVDHQEDARRIWMAACEGMEEHVSDFPIVRRSGMHAAVALSLRAQRVADEDGVIIVMNDLSEHRLPGTPSHPGYPLGDIAEFLSTLAHEVRNPLTGISTNVQYMQMTFEESETQKEIYSDIMTAVGRLDLMFREIVEYARPMELRLEKADLSRILSDALSEQEELIREHKKIEFIRQLDESLPHVEVDAERFHRALALLLEHCVREVNEDGRITAVCKATPEEIRLSISHNGQNLSAPRLRQLFEPSASLKSAESGLGLAFAKRVFNEHNCRLDIESKHGRGTQFVVTFPLHVKSSS